MVQITARGLRRALRADGRRPGPPGRHRPVDRGRAGPAPPAARRPSSAAASRSASRWRRARRPAPRARRTPSSPTRSCSTTGASSGPTSASGTAGSSRSAGPATPTSPTGCTRTCRSGRRTDVISGEGKILTAGGIDTHVHLISPSQIVEALATGLTTLGGGGTGPSRGHQGDHGHARRLAPGSRSTGPSTRTRSTCCCSARATRCPMAGLRSRRSPAPAATRCTRTGAPPRPRSTPRCAAADEWGLQVALHSDSLNEAGYVASTIAAIGGRSISAFHVEGAGGGHAPDILTLAGLPNVIPGSTNPTLPHTVNTVAEHLDMLMVCHHLNPAVPEDLAFAESRIRGDHHRRRGHPARHGRDLDHLLRRAGDGPDRRGDLPHLAGRARDEGPARRSSAAACRPTTSGPSGTSRSTRSTRRSPTASTTRSAPSSRASWPTWCCGSRSSSASGRPWCSRAAAWSGVRSGDPNASIPTPQPVLMRPALTDAHRRRPVAVLRLAGRDRRRAGRAARPAAQAVRGQADPRRRQGADDQQRRAAGHRHQAGDVRDLHRRRGRRARPGERLPLAQLYSMF